MSILVLNSGSSSLKVGLFDEDLAPISRELTALRRTKAGRACWIARTEKRSALSDGPEILEAF